MVCVHTEPIGSYCNAAPIPFFCLPGLVRLPPSALSIVASPLQYYFSIIYP